MADTSKNSPKHGSSPQSELEGNESKPSVSQADGTAAAAPRGETEPPTTADPTVTSQTPENRAGKVNPSAPNKGTSGMPANTTRDSSGEVGEPTGEGTLDAPKENEQPGRDKDGNKKEEAA
ncbi:MAG: hypothetical protein ABIP81_01315 [Terriglobales bacterium]